MLPDSISRPPSESSGNSVNTGRWSINDIESGPTPRKATKLRWLLEMPERVQDERYFTADAKKRTVYRKLMNHLDAVEGTESYFSFTLTAFQVVVFSILLIVIACTLTMEKISYRRFLHLRKWQYVATVMAVATSLSIVRIITFLLFCPVLWWWRIHKYVVYFVRQLKRYIDVTLWFCIVFLSWCAWFCPRLNDISETATHRITYFLSALCIGSILFLLKNILYFKLEADLHYDQLFDRIRMSVIYLHALQFIHNRGRWRFLPDKVTKKKLMKLVTGTMRLLPAISSEDEIWTKGENLLTLVLEMDKESVPIWILRRLATEYLEQVKLRPLPGQSDIITKDDREILREAKNMFRRLIDKKIWALNLDNIRDLEVKWEDLERYGLEAKELGHLLKPLKQQEEEEDEAESSERTISYYEFLNWTVLAFKTCWALEPSLNSSERVFIKLNRLMNLFLVTVVVIIWLLLSGIMNIGELVLLLTPFLAASFVFGDSCKKMFEGLVFAFAMHPFNSGDRVIIDKVQMRVTELNILTSCFHKYDTKEEVVIPNSTLTTTNIINLDIAPSQSDKVEFFVSSQIPLEDVKNLEIKIKKYLDDEIVYSSNNMVVKSEVGEEGMKMVVYFKYFVSYVTAESIAMDKSMIVSKIMEFRKRMDQRKSKNLSPYYDLYSVEISFTHKAKLKDIEDLENEILRALDDLYFSSSKVVITELTRSIVKIGLYIYNLDDPKQDQIEDIEDETHKIWRRSGNRGRVKNNLQEVSDHLERKKIVGEVSIYHMVINGRVEEVSAQGGTFQAKQMVVEDTNCSQIHDRTLWDSYRATQMVVEDPNCSPIQDYTLWDSYKAVMGDVIQRTDDAGVGTDGTNAKLTVIQQVEEGLGEQAQSQQNKALSELHSVYPYTCKIKPRFQFKFPGPSFSSKFKNRRKRKGKRIGKEA